MEPTEKENSNQNAYEPFEKDPKMEIFDLNFNEEEEKLTKIGDVPEEKPQKKRKFCKKFPSVFLILLGFEVFSYILTFIVEKGKYQTLEYSKGQFIRKYQNQTTMTMAATQELLNELGIKIPLDNFKEGLITKPVPIPGTYEKIEG